MEEAQQPVDAATQSAHVHNFYIDRDISTREITKLYRWQLCVHAFRCVTTRISCRGRIQKKSARISYRLRERWCVAAISFFTQPTLQPDHRAVDIGDAGQVADPPQKARTPGGAVFAVSDPTRHF